MRHQMLKVGALAGVLAALAATQLYYVREMLAALVLFSIGFALMVVAILILFLLDQGLYSALAWAGAHAVGPAQQVDLSRAHLEQLPAASVTARDLGREI